VSTGGGTGLGFAIAKELALLGANVVIAARRLELLEEAAATINNLVAQQEGAKGGKVSDICRASKLQSDEHFTVEGSLFTLRV
jgi:NAD(P)-dependent dehydrogenase (short-subunit alcohol dehydrogenase family)